MIDDISYYLSQLDDNNTVSIPRKVEEHDKLVIALVGVLVSCGYSYNVRTSGNYTVITIVSEQLMGTELINKGEE